MGSPALRRKQSKKEGLSESLVALYQKTKQKVIKKLEEKVIQSAWTGFSLFTFIDTVIHREGLYEHHHVHGIK